MKICTRCKLEKPLSDLVLIKEYLLDFSLGVNLVLLKLLNKID